MMKRRSIVASFGTILAVTLGLLTIPAQAQTRMQQAVPVSGPVTEPVTEPVAQPVSQPVSGPAETPRRVAAPRVLMIGDSMLFTNKISGRSVGRQLEWLIGTRITDRSFVGTRFLLGLPNVKGAIPRQYSGGPWDVVVMNGGGNDLMFGCGCNRCGPTLDALISEDGLRGAIPSLVARIRQSGAQVVYSGYLRSPGVDSLIESCRDEGAVLESRLSKMAAQVPGVTFVSMADLVPFGDSSYHLEDMIHPSPKGSRAIAERLAMALPR